MGWWWRWVAGGGADWPWVELVAVGGGWSGWQQGWWCYQQ